jgi:hypothetical protein
VLRGLDDFRVRVQENGIGSMDVSDYLRTPTLRSRKSPEASEHLGFLTPF